MEITWKVKGSGEAALAASRDGSTSNICSAIMTFGFSTKPADESPAYHTDEIAAATALEELEQAIDSINEQATNVNEMLHLAKQDLATALDRVNQKLIAFGNLVAAGIYAGGCVFHTMDDHFICVPFGGAYAYKWDGNHIKLVSGGPSPDGLIRDAIGASGNKHMKLYYDLLEPAQKLILSSDPLYNIAFCEECLREESHSDQLEQLYGEIQWNRKNGVLMMITNL